MRALTSTVSRILTAGAVVVSGVVVPVGVAGAADPPASVTIAGSLQSELGCAADWDPACTSTHLTWDATDQVWQATFALPAGSFEYKAALNGSWDRNYGANAAPGGANIVLNLPAARDVTFIYDDETHWVTDNVTSAVATAAGSFQSELGCSEDWQPDCLRSWLQDADGDRTYTFTTDDLPVGGYEFKVARDESWTLNYGTNGVPNGANIAFLVGAANDVVTISYDLDTNIPTVTVNEPPPDAALAATSVRQSVVGEKFYFVLPDRFANGSTANDTAGVDAAQGRLVHGLDVTDKGFYHGGDLAGLTGKLDYLDDLGITAIWMTPMFKNRWVQGSGADVSAGYHGYWTTDFTQIDPHFGTNQEMTDLIAAAHAKGMKVFFDIITNHTADVVKYAENQYSYRSKGAYPYVDAEGNEFDDAAVAGSPDFPTLEAGSFPYTPVVPDGMADVKRPAWLNDVTLYHNRGDSTFAGESSQYGDFFGLDDLFTENPAVVEGMIDIFSTWITELDIDGYRIDTVKHVNDQFWTAFAPAIQQYASDHGNDDFFFFGEVFEGNPAFTSRYTTDLKLPAILDFPFQSAAASFAGGASTAGLRDLFAQDDLYIDNDSNAYSLPTFLGNHDMGRIGWFLRNSGDLMARDQLAHTLMYLARGNPVVYYGDEQGFVGDGGDKDARQDMFGSQVASYNDDDLIGTDATTADDNFDPSHPLYQHIAALADLTEAHPALRTGLQQHRLAGTDPGVYAFSRMDWAEGVEYVVALNNTTSAKSASVPTYSAGMGFTGLWPSGLPASTSQADRTVQLTVPPLSAVVYRAQDAVADAPAPGVTVTKPAVGSEVTGEITVGADLTSSAPAQVTFAYRAGDGDWTAIGTDDNAPYSVQFDVSGLAKGTPVELRAIAKTRSGELSASSAVVTVGEVVAPPPATGSGADYLVVHYNRPDGNYDGWGLHAFGDIDQTVEWASPIPFTGEDSYGRFAWVKLKPGGSNVGLIVHNGDTKDPANSPDRFVNPQVTPEVWLESDDAAVHQSLAAARGFARIHYNRPAGDYDGWGLHLWGDAIADGVGTEWPTPRVPDGTDGFGVYWDVPLENPAAALNFIIHNGDAKDPGPDQSFIPAVSGEVWRNQGVETIFRTGAAARNVAEIHYNRPDGDYGDYGSPNFTEFWGLHVWTGAATGTDWPSPLKPVRMDAFGPVFEVPLATGATRLNFILHRGDAKDPNGDQALDLAVYGNQAWYVSGQQRDEQIRWLLPIVARGVDADLSKAQAHWVAEDTLLWKAEGPATLAYSLRWSGDGGITAAASGVTGGRTIRLSYDPDGMTPQLAEKWPHLSGYQVFKVRSADLKHVRAALRGQVVAVERAADGTLRRATSVQIPGVLDDLYAAAAERVVLGPTVTKRSATLRLWAPTAQTARLLVFDSPTATAPSATLDMRRDDASGVWSAKGRGWKDKYYLFEVKVWAPTTLAVVTNQVTDPYSLSLATNSARSQVVDLDDSRTMPAGWERTRKPALGQPEDISIYELHVRDFSIGDPTVPAAAKGTYSAFGVRRSNGMRHLSDLQKAGLTHVHLLPVFDIATVPERRADQAQPACDLPAITASAGPASPNQQACVEPVRGTDGFNWGYDPFHYTTPEGSYATNPEGWSRTKEFRGMVASLNEQGLRVVMDVVYNHTTAAGQDSRSVLDRIVPGYYQRLDENGAVATSTCCSNTATEHEMMGKLMIDSVVTWATQYKVDGFRFDLMGHHSKENLLDLRAALDALTVKRDGVDGKSIYLYGEGWNFGEVANDARFVQATQANMAGTGIGTFSDRLRDAARGGGPFDENPRIQGFASGLLTDPNGESVNGTADQQRDRLRHYEDLLKAGLAGNLADFTFLSSRTGQPVTGAQVDYNGSPAGYTDDPSDVVTYVDAHDNETLFDALAYKLPYDTTGEDRTRMNLVGHAAVAMAQGPAFFHAGTDLLRSKSLDRNSYNSGDWFNRIDWSGGQSTFGSGLPPAGDNESKWSFATDALTQVDRPTAAEQRSATDRFQELLAVSASSPLFRLATAELIQQRVSFPKESIDGLVVMRLSDRVGKDLDRHVEDVAVVFNATASTQQVAAPSTGRWDLHQVQRHSVDPVVRTASWSGGKLTVPPRTVAVFVQR